MTTSQFPGEFEFSDNHGLPTGPGSSEHLSDAGELIAAIPAILGFPPTDSVVAMCLMGSSPTTLGAVVRHDCLPGLDGRPEARTHSALRQFSAVCDVEGAAAVVLVVIADYPMSESLIIAEAFEELLADTETELVDVLHTVAVEHDRPWTSVLCPNHYGTVPDPASSCVAAAQVLGGRVIRTSRDELVSSVEGRAQDQDVIAGLISGHRKVVDGRSSTGGGSRIQDDVTCVLQWIDAVEAGVCLDPQSCAELAVALMDVRVRDVLMGLAITGSAAAAEHLWLTLTHELPSPERAWPATLLGFFAYVRGDGPLAGVALSAALAADPTHTLAGLLDMSLKSGMRPGGIRDLAAVGLSIGELIGIVGMPPELR